MVVYDQEIGETQVERKSMSDDNSKNCHVYNTFEYLSIILVQGNCLLVFPTVKLYNKQRVPKCVYV